MIVKIVEYTHKIVQNILLHIQSFNINYGKLLQKGFSDGARWLKENPNWHNVACGDLPLANCIVLCMYKPENTNHYNHYPTMAYLHYDWSDKIWSNPNDSKPVPKAAPDYWIDIKLPE